MELRIKKINSPGDLRSECIELLANSPSNLKNFIISDSYYTLSHSDCRKHLYWFPEFPVKTGQLIRLNTRTGMNDLSAGELYWNLEKALWKDKFISAYLIKIDDYVMFPDTKRYLDNLFSAD